MKIILPQTIKDELCRHARETGPKECCGFLIGQDRNDRRVTILRRVRNARTGDQHRRFLIDPADYRKAEKYAGERDLDLLGVYHSHPDHPAEPSEHDRRSALPWFSYIIVSVRNGSVTELRSWRLDEDRTFTEESVETGTENYPERNTETKISTHR